VHACTHRHAGSRIGRNRACTGSEYSPPQYLVTSTRRPNHRPYLHPRRSVAESAAIFYTREHILHCDVGRFASLRKAQAARASAILVHVGWGGPRARESSVPVSEKTNRSRKNERDDRTGKGGSGASRRILSPGGRFFI